MDRKVREPQSFVEQIRKNLVHYENRLNDLLKQKDEGKTYLSRDGTDLVPSMIANEESTVSQYREVLADVEHKRGCAC